MTPAEFATHLEGYRRSQMRQWERAAWQVSLLLAPHMKKGRRPPSVNKLLGRVGRPKNDE